MCSRYEHKKDEAKIKLREKIYVFGAVPRANIRPTDLGPIILPDEDSFACREMRWGWQVPWDKSPLINAKSETLMLPALALSSRRTMMPALAKIAIYVCQKSFHRPLHF